MQETQVQSLGQEDPLEEGVATHSSILAWGIPWTKEAGRLQSMGSQRVKHDLAIKQQQKDYFDCQNLGRLKTAAGILWVEPGMLPNIL